MVTTCDSRAAADRQVKPARLQQLAQLWACRLLLNGRGYRALDERKCRFDEDLCRFVGLDPQRAGSDRHYARQRLRSTLSRLGRQVTRFPAPLADRLDDLGGHLTLDPVEREVLGLMTMISVSDGLREAAQTTSQAESLDHLGLAACALDRPPVEIEPVLRPTGRLARSGLLRFNMERGSRHMRLSESLGAPAFELLGGLAAALTSRTDSIDNLLAQYFQRVTLDEGDTFDFSHCADELRHLGGMIDHALEHGESGVNILIHGQPGVGKTELTRHLATRHGWDLYTVSASDTEEDFLTGRRRFRACQFCQFLLARRDRGVLLFDEIEDVFDPRFTTMPDRLGWPGSTGKAWTNRLLESNPRPVVWISNSTDMLDPAYLRRFDYILRLDTPARPARRRMLSDVLEGIAVPAEWIDERAGDSDMTPARIAQMGRLARRLKTAVTEVELPGVLDEQLEQQRWTDRAETVRCKRRGNPLHVYDLDFLNTQPAAESLLNGLERRASGSVLMYGPPGSGKTAFAEFVADRLGRELEARSASALLDKFVGETEKALARMFAEAASSGAVLLLDEADNFLSARESARNHWELTQTNELLVQMERFDGMFLCATNLVNALDPAAMRRFDVKLGFDYLTESQRWQLFLRLLACHGLSEPDPKRVRESRRRLAVLDQLTPGDFTATARGNSLLEETAHDANSLLARLEDEHRLKPGAGHMRPGFV